MRSIISDGGPFIVLHQGLAADWKGVFGRGNVDAHASDENDYEAVCDVCLSTLPSHSSIFTGSLGSSLILTHPYETAIVHCDKRSVLLAQMIYADEGFGFNSIGRDSLSKMQDLEEEKIISLAAGHYHIIDAANAFDDVDVNSEMLSFEMKGGRCRIRSGTFGDPDRFMAILTMVSSIDIL